MEEEEDRLRVVRLWDGAVLVDDAPIPIGALLKTTWGVRLRVEARRNEGDDFRVVCQRAPYGRVLLDETVAPYDDTVPTPSVRWVRGLCIEIVTVADERDEDSGESVDE